MVVDQQREIGICAHGQRASMGVDVRGLYVYQVDWARRHIIIICANRKRSSSGPQRAVMSV